MAASGVAAFLANQVRVHTQALATAKDELQAAVALQLAAESSVKALETEISSLKASGDKARSQLMSKEAEVADMTRSLAAAQKNVADLQAKYKAAASEAERAESQSMALKERIAAAEAQAQSVPDQINTLNTEVSEPPLPSPPPP